jgi:type IV secretion system protein VirB7
MRTLFFPLLLLMALAGCQSGEELAVCKGPAFALNTGHWQPTDADLAASTQTVQGQQ